MSDSTQTLSKVSRKVYVDSPKEVPDWVELERGSRGGLYYELSFADLPEPIREAVFNISDRIREIMENSLRDATEAAEEGRVQVNLDTYVLDLARPEVEEELETELDGEITFRSDVYKEVVGVVMETYLDQIT